MTDIKNENFLTIIKARELSLDLIKTLEILSKDYEPAYEEIKVGDMIISNEKLREILQVFANGIETDYLI